MGYIHDLDAKLSGMLSELSEARRREVVTFVKSVAIESYQNGIQTGRLTKSVPSGRKSTAAADKTLEKADVPQE